MPRKSDTIAINNPKHDRRVKLTEEDKENIRIEYSKGDTSHNKLAVKYGVSKRLISFVLNPDKLEKAKEQFSERRKDGRYYDKDKHREATRSHRDHKKKLYKEGLLVEDK